MASISDDLRSAEAFFKHMHDIAMSNSCQHLCKVVTENEELRQKNGGWEITNRNNIESLATLRLQVKDGIEQASVQAAKLEELTKEKKEVEAALAVKNSSMVEIEKKLHAKDSEVITLTKRVKQDERNGAQLKKQMADGEKSLEVARDEKAQMSKELSEMRASFSEKSERLDRLEKLEVKLQNPRKEELCRDLQAIFDSLDKLVQTSVGDVKDVALNQTGWKDFVNHKAFKEADIPWPPTNTPDAKSVRRAGVLCICAWALELHIFQSCHLVDNDNQLSEILDELADENPDSEPHIRSILLRLQQERKTDSPYTRVDLASEAVSTYIRPLMADAEVQAVFNSSLKNIFMDACKLWREVQKLKPKITASMDESDGEDWALVSLRRPLNTKKLTQTPNGNSRVDGDATNKSSKKPSAIKVNVVPEDIMIVLWPAFLITENGKTKTLMKGYAVSEPELAAARAEAHASRRAARQNNRMVNPRRRSSISQSNGKANDGPPFLSQGGESG